MRKDCKKEAKDFDNGVQELAYTLGQVTAQLTDAIIAWEARTML